MFKRKVTKEKIGSSRSDKAKVFQFIQPTLHASDPDQLPQYNIVLTSENGPFSDVDRESIAAISSDAETSKQAVLLYLNQTKYYKNAHALQTRLIQEGYKVTDVISCNQKVIHHIYGMGDVISKDVIDNLTDIHLVSESDDSRMQIKRIFNYAIENNVSDVHIRVYRSFHHESEVLMRIDTLVNHFTKLSFKEANELTWMLYSMCDLDGKQVTCDVSKSQDSSMTYNEYELPEGGTRDFRIRYSLNPTGYGWKIVLRFQEQFPVSFIPELSKLGFLEQQLDYLQSSIVQPKGVIIFCGPTGSGKTTSLQSLVKVWYEHFNGQRVGNSVEDPIELKLPGIDQSQLVRHKNMSAGDVRAAYREALIAAMRQDPDLLLMSEIRDPSSAAIAADMVATGHLVLTTLHAQNPIIAYERYMTLGDSRVIASDAEHCLAVVSQRMVPLVCPHCSIPYNKAEILKGLRDNIDSINKYNTDKVRVRGKGCKHCNNRSTKGKTALIEIMIPDDRIMSCFAKKDIHGAKNAWLDRSGANAHVNGWTIVDSALKLILSGMICPVDAAAQTGLLSKANAFTEDIL